MMGSAGELPTEPQEKAVFVEDMTEKELADAFDQPSGLINLGNTCYLNATIQSLSTVPELRESLKKYYHYHFIHKYYRLFSSSS